MSLFIDSLFFDSWKVLRCQSLVQNTHAHETKVQQDLKNITVNIIFGGYLPMTGSRREMILLTSGKSRLPVSLIYIAVNFSGATGFLGFWVSGFHRIDYFGSLLVQYQKDVGWQRISSPG